MEEGAYEYPMWFREKTQKFIVRFDGLCWGEVIVGGGAYEAGYYIGKPEFEDDLRWTEHTNTEVWEDVTHLYKKPFSVEEKSEKPINLIDDVQQERESVYGKFEVQCRTVGKIVMALIECSRLNRKEPTDEQVGSFVYTAIKQARYAVSPKHADTLIDLESYCNLIKKMELDYETTTKP